MPEPMALELELKQGQSKGSLLQNMREGVLLIVPVGTSKRVLVELRLVLPVRNMGSQLMA